jgi:hypothetical protein
MKTIVEDVVRIIWNKTDESMDIIKIIYHAVGKLYPQLAYSLRALPQPERGQGEKCDHVFSGNDMLCKKCGLYFPETKQPVPAKVELVPTRLLLSYNLEDQKLDKVEDKNVCKCKINNPLPICKTFNPRQSPMSDYCECGHHKSCHAQGAI